MTAPPPPIEAKLQKLLGILAKPTTPEQQKAVAMWLPKPKN